MAIVQARRVSRSLRLLWFFRPELFGSRANDEQRHSGRRPLSTEEEMAIINFGSINIDHVYQVDHFVQPGETLASTHYQQLLGGKGANQSIALAQAGADVCHVGSIHENDAAFKQALIKKGVDCRGVKCSETPSGHAIIQVTPSGENAIVLFGGANQTITAKIYYFSRNSYGKRAWVYKI